MMILQNTNISLLVPYVTNALFAVAFRVFHLLDHHLVFVSVILLLQRVVLGLSLVYPLQRSYSVNYHHRSTLFPQSKRLSNRFRFDLSKQKIKRFSSPEEIFEKYINEKQEEKECECGDQGSFNPFDDTNSVWEECMRRVATESLVPVLYPPRQVETDSLQRPILPEKALKNLLRKYQKIAQATPTITFEERKATRKRLSHLILGTSVMRIWYHHLYTSMLQEAGDEREVEPLFNIPIAFSRNNATLLQVSSTCSSYKSVTCVPQQDIVRAMVDLHAKYTLTNSLDQNDAQCHTAIRSKSIEEISIRRSLPLFLSKMISDQYGIQEADRIARVFNSPGPITIRRNALKCLSDKDLCERLLKDENVKVIRLSSLTKQRENSTSYLFPVVHEGCIRLLPQSDGKKFARSIWSMSAWIDGWFEVQDAGSQFIANAMEARYGETIIDYCAGNGGKTFALASGMFADRIKSHGAQSSSFSEMVHSSRIIAHDTDPDRLSRLRGSFKRIGLFDSKISIETISDAQILKEVAVDGVLVDAPCSSSGVLRRRPSHRFQITEQEILDVFPSLQLNILINASKTIKVGGRLVYATCSILKYENEDVVDMFESSDGFENWIRWPFSTEGTGDDGTDSSIVYDRPHCRALLPSVHDCDGFFVARWKRVG